MSRRARMTLIWGAVFAVVAHVGLSLWLEWGPPWLRDPEFGRRLTALRQRQCEHTGRPLWLALGSSRMAMALKPGCLAPSADEPDRPLLFNFAMVCSGPARQRLALERLLSTGVRPTRLFLEVWPPFAVPTEADGIDPNRLSHNDMRSLMPLASDAPALRSRWAEARLSPWFSHRHLLLNQTVPEWLPLSRRQDVTEWAIDDWGWLRPIPIPNAAAQRPQFLEATRAQFGPRLASPELLHPSADRALRDLIQVACGAKVTLVWLPEASEFRSWYSLANQTAITDWLTALARETGCDLLDARTWAEDAHLLDGVHLTAEGADAFTCRFGRAQGVTP